MLCIYVLCTCICICYVYMYMLCIFVQPGTKTVLHNETTASLCHLPLYLSLSFVFAFVPSLCLCPSLMHLPLPNRRQLPFSLITLTLYGLAFFLYSTYCIYQNGQKRCFHKAEKNKLCCEDAAHEAWSFCRGIIS